MTTAVTLGLAVLLALAYAACWPLLGHLDNRLEEPMPSPLHTLRNAARHWLGTAHIDDLPERLTRMENSMTSWTTVLNGLVEQTTAASAAQATSFSNLQGAITRQTTAIGDLQRQLETAIANGDTVPEGMQAKVAEISAALDDMKKAADTADNGFEPVDEEPAEPETPVEETPANPDVPAEPTPDVPVDTTEPGNTARHR